MKMDEWMDVLVNEQILDHPIDLSSFTETWLCINVYFSLNESTHLSRINTHFPCLAEEVESQTFLIQVQSRVPDLNLTHVRVKVLVFLTLT